MRVKCIDDGLIAKCRHIGMKSERKHLGITKGKIYNVENSRSPSQYIFIGDRNKPCTMYKSRFIPIDFNKDLITII
jgi:hypothetical protein